MGSNQDWKRILDLEAAFYETLVPGAPQIKVAMLIARTCDAPSTPEEEIINVALDRLLTRKDVHSVGDVHSWRWSEIWRSLTNPD